MEQKKNLEHYYKMTLNNTDTIYVWTDGSCNHSDGLGGIGIYMRHKMREKKISFGYQNTKTGRMEIKAVIIALRAIKSKKYNIVFYSDSQYVVNSINIWMKKWIKLGWIGIKNTDLWAQFLCEYKKFDQEKITFFHVKGHTNKDDIMSLGNQIADELADYKRQKVVHKDDLFL